MLVWCQRGILARQYSMQFAECNTIRYDHETGWRPVKVQSLWRQRNRNGVMAAGGRSPLMRRRRLAAELHRLRAASHLTLEDVADHLECSPAKISRIENGQVAVRIQDARELLDLYDVDEDQRELLLQLVRQARGKGWWSDYADLLDEGDQTLLSLEDEASAILVYETNLIAPLLQSRRYAWELTSSRNDSRLDLV